jgi:hypothetical protein
MLPGELPAKSSVFSRHDIFRQVSFDRVDCFRVARLNVVAGATDASRAMLLTLCRKVELLTAIFGFLWFS